LQLRAELLLKQARGRVWGKRRNLTERGGRKVAGKCGVLGGKQKNEHNMATLRESLDASPDKRSEVKPSEQKKELRLE